MKRESRQHGMVRTYMALPSPWNPRPKSKIVNQLDCPPTAGFFVKVSSKPTNHSKFTGKCGRPRCAGCHIHPDCKSKDKAKGTHKFRSREMVMIQGRVEDKGHGLNYNGMSATKILGHLTSDHWDDEVEDDINDNYDDFSAIYDDSPAGSFCMKEEWEVGSRGMASEDNDHDENGIRLGLVLEHEDWCVVGEM